MACTYIASSYAPTNLAVILLVGEHHYLIVGISPVHSMYWHVMVVYPMTLHVVVAVDTCMDKNHTVVNIVLMYQKVLNVYKARAYLNSFTMYL